MKDLFLESIEIVRNAWAAIWSGEVSRADGIEVIENTLAFVAEKVQLKGTK